MKTVKQTLLHFQQANSNKVYNVYLIEVSDGLYLVNFEYGRYGGKLKEGTKTASPVELTKAQKLYDTLVSSKVTKNYKIELGYNPATKTEKKGRDSLNSQEYKSFIISKLQKAVDTKEKIVDNYHLSKLIYRAGDLKIEEAKRIILSIYDLELDNTNAYYYSLVWALGRFRDSSLAPTIESLREKLEDSSHYIVNEALLSLPNSKDMESIKNIELNEKCNTLDKIKTLSEHIYTTNKKSISEEYWDEREVLEKELKELFPIAEEVYLKLYILSLVDSDYRDMFIEVIPYLPITKPNFYLFRRLYKIAEFRDDYEVLAELVTRLESIKMACYQTFNWDGWDGTGDYPSSPSVGCSRLYFKKRSFRYLKSLAQNDESGYLEFAKYLLISMNSYPTQFDAFTTESYDDNWNLKKKNYDKFAVHLTLMYILYKESGRYMIAPSKKLWEIANKSIKEKHNTQAHTELWDKNPQVALEILSKSSVEEIQIFAFDIVQKHPSVIENAPLEMLLPMINLKYLKARKFFFELLKKRYTKSKEVAILEAFLFSHNNTIANYSLDIIAKNRDILYIPNIISKAILTMPKARFDRLLNILKDMDKLESIVDDIVSLSINQTLDETIQKRLFETLKALNSHLNIGHFEKMLEREELNYSHILVGQLLRSRLFEHIDIPLSIKEQIARYENPEMLATTLYLLGRLDAQELMNSYEILLSFLYSTDKVVSLEASKIIISLGSQKQEYAKVFLVEIIERSFTSTPEPIYNYILKSFKALKLAYKEINNNQVYRLLIAKSKMALDIGTILLSSQTAKSFSVTQWARLAKNPNKKVRKWAYGAYTKNIDTVVEAMPKSLMIFDTSWEDTRAFACEYFEKFEPLSDSDIVIIADSNYDDVQLFAKKIIEEREIDSEGILFKLSQHPAVRVQNFVVDLMMGGISKSNILNMERFFNTVLHSVNKNRVAKQRVIEILNSHIKDREIAQMYARLASNHSASMVWADKSSYVEAMVEIRELYDDISLPIEIQENELKEIAKKEFDYGV
ncbi:MAG: hypothetical protein QM493_01570 [Sulfurovum sp.]